MTQTAREILAHASFTLHEDEFLLVQLPPSAVVAVAAVIAELADPFIAFIVDSREITLLLDTESFDEYKHRLPSATIAEVTYRLLTLEQNLTNDIVGLLALIAQALADAQVPILALSAYAHDHFFVPTQQAELALETLTKLQATLRSL